MNARIDNHDVMHAKQITVRNVTEDLATKLKELAKVRGESVNSTILYLLRQALDADERRQRLERYATWSGSDREQFDAALSAQRTIDESLWK